MTTRLLPAAKNQPQTVDCSHFVVLAVHLDLSDAHVNRHLDRMAEVRGISARVARQSISRWPWESRRRPPPKARSTRGRNHQVYIALGTFMAAAALLGVDTCPMEEGNRSTGRWMKSWG